MVIVMLSILSATALPKFFEKNTFAERAFFDDCLNALRYAQKLAVATNCDVQVSFSSNEYKLKRPKVRDNCRSLAPLSDSDLDNVKHPSTGENYSGDESGVSTSTSTVVFYALGNASADTTITVGSNSIKVVAKTGFVYAP